MTMRSDQILTDDAINFIVWAKRNGKKGNYIQSALNDYADIQISQGRISQVWKKDGKRRNVGNSNPYSDLMENEDLDESEETDLRGFSKDMVDEALAAQHKSLQEEDIKDPEDESTTDDSLIPEFDSAIPINWKSILETTGLKPVKVKQIISLIDITDNSASEVARILDVAQVSFAIQKQILTAAYGLDYAKKVMSDRKSGTSSKNPNSDSISQAMSQATSILNQKMRSQQAQIAYEEVNDILRRIDQRNQGGEPEDPMKLAKDIMALQAMSRTMDSKDNSFNDRIMSVVLEKAFENKDTNLLDTIKFVMELTKQNQPSQNNPYYDQMQREMSDLRRMQMQQQTDSMQRMLELQAKNYEAQRKADEQLTNQLREADKQKIELLAEQLKDKVAGSVRSYDDFLNDTQNKINAYKQLGLVGDNKVGDAEQQTAIERLKTAENLIEKIPDKISSGADKAFERLESMMIKYMEYNEKREQRQANTMNFQQNTNRPPKPIRSEAERTSILNSLEERVTDIDKARARRERVRQLNSIG